MKGTTTADKTEKVGITLPIALVKQTDKARDTIGGGYFVGLLAGYAIKKAIKIIAVIVGMFIAVLAYLEYQRIIGVDWEKLQMISQSGITWLVSAVTHISNNIGATHTGALSNLGIPLASSASAGFVLGMVRG